MQKLRYTTFLFLLLGHLAFAQNPAIFSLSASHLQFPITMVGKMDSLQLTISNPGFNARNFHLSIPFQEYGSQPFFLKDTALVVEQASTKSFWVYFRPVHNIANKAALILASSPGLFPNWQMPEQDILQIQIPLLGQGRFPHSYYATTENLAEEALKQALKTRLALNYNSLGYNTARDQMYGSIDNNNDSVTCIYTNRKAKFNTRAGATSNNFNCEHTFPQGYFNQDEPMRSDIHHLFSTDETANNSRGNLPFGIATAPFVANNAANFPSSNGGGKYEPQDSHKGRCARAMMYFVLRYQDYTNFFQPQNAILRQWHKQFPVTPKDTVRNAAIFALQGNRNPFEDYPQLSERISNLIVNSVSDSTPKIRVSQRELYFGGFNFQGESQKFSVIVYNTGNQKLKISKVKITGDSTSLENPSDTAFELGKNEARTLFLRVKCKTGFGDEDTIKISSNDPENPLFHILFFQCVHIGVEKLRNFSTLAVVPNPVAHSFSIDGLPENQEAGLEWFSSLGKSLASQKLVGSQTLMQPQLPPGAYFLKITCGDSYRVKKVILQGQ